MITEISYISLAEQTLTVLHFFLFVCILLHQLLLKTLEKISEFPSSIVRENGLRTGLRTKSKRQANHHIQNLTAQIAPGIGNLVLLWQVLSFFLCRRH
jgi:hypothetical protein